MLLRVLAEIQSLAPRRLLNSPSDLVIVIQEVPRITLGETLPSSPLPFVSYLFTTAWNLIDHPLVTNSVLFPFKSSIL